MLIQEATKTEGRIASDLPIVDDYAGQMDEKNRSLDNIIILLPKFIDLFRKVDGEIQNGTRLVLIDGQKGSGKTTLCREFLQRWKRNENIICDKSLSDSFRQDIDSDAETREKLLTELNEWQNSMPMAKLLLFVLDDAQELSYDALEFLLEIGHSDIAHFINLAIIAFGNFDSMLFLEEINPILVGQYQIEPFNLLETEVFFSKLLKNLSGSDRDFQMIDNEIIEWIHQKSGGLPGKIKSLTIDLWQYARQFPLRGIDRELIRQFAQNENHENRSPRVHKQKQQAEKRADKSSPANFESQQRRNEKSVRLEESAVPVPSNRKSGDRADESQVLEQLQRESSEQLQSQNTVLDQSDIDELIDNFTIHRNLNQSEDEDDSIDGNGAEPSNGKTTTEPPKAGANQSDQTEDSPETLSQTEIEVLFNSKSGLSNTMTSDSKEETQPESYQQHDVSITISQEQLDQLIINFLTRQKHQQADSEEIRTTVTRVAGTWPMLPRAPRHGLLRKRERPLVAIELGTGSIKLFVLNGDYSLRNLTVIPINQELGQAIAYGNLSEKFLRELYDLLSSEIEALGLKQCQTLVTFAGKNQFSINMEMIRLPAKEMENAILFQIEGNYDFFENVEKIVRFKIQGNSTKNPGLLDVYCSVASKACVENLNLLFDELGLEVQRIEPNSLAIHDYFNYTGILDKHHLNVVVDIGTHSTDIIVVAGNRILLSKTSNSAAFTLNQNIADALMINYQKAETLKKKFGTCLRPHKEEYADQIKNIQVYEAILPGIEQLSAEVKRIIESCRIDFPDQTIEKIILCGGGSSLRAIHEYMSANLKLPVVKVDLPKGIPFSLTPETGIEPVQMMPLMGVLFSHLLDENEINFSGATRSQRSLSFSGQKRQNKQKYTIRGSKKPLVVIGLGILYIAGLVFVNQSIKAYEQKNSTIADQLTSAEQKLEELDAVLAQSKTLKQQILLVEGLINQRQNYSESLHQLPLLCPPGVVVNNLSAKSGLLIIDGSAPNASYFPRFLANLRQLKGFPEAELRYVNRNENNTIDYQIICKPDGAGTIMTKPLNAVKNQ